MHTPSTSQTESLHLTQPSDTIRAAALEHLKLYGYGARLGKAEPDSEIKDAWKFSINQKGQEEVDSVQDAGEIIVDAEGKILWATGPEAVIANAKRIRETTGPLRAEVVHLMKHSPESPAIEDNALLRR